MLYVRVVPTLKVAFTGAVINPVTPWPTPLKNPFTPFYLAPSKGFLKTPVTPVYKSLPVCLIPYSTVSITESVCLIRELSYSPPNFFTTV